MHVSNPAYFHSRCINVHLNRRKIFTDLGEIRNLSFYSVVGLTMQLLIWFVNSNVQNAFSTSIIGLAYGPVFPAALTLANDILPPDIRMVSMAFM